MAWTSSDERVVTVTADGEIEAVGEGVVTVSARSAADPAISDSIGVRARFSSFDDGAFVSYADAPSGYFNREFVAVDGDILLVPWVADGSTGRVTVYRRLSGGGWVDEAQLYPPIEPDRPYRHFGKAIEVRGSTAIAVSEYRVASDPDAYESRIHIFGREGPGDWHEHTELLQGEGVGLSLSYHGDLSVSLSPGVLVVGVPGRDSGDPGVARIYEQDASDRTSWSLSAEIQPRVSTFAAYFGTDVDISQDGRLIAVAQSLQDNGSGLGTHESAYVFERTGVDWREWREVDVVPYPELVSPYSTYVEIDGDILAITEMPSWGNPSVDVRIYRRGVGGVDNWGAVYNRTLTIPLPEGLGILHAQSSIRAVGGTVVVGLAGLHCLDPQSEAAACGPGEVHVLRLDESTSEWDVDQVLQPSGAYDHQVFGAAVDVSSDGRILVVGSNPRSGFDVRSSGEVFAFER